MPGIGVSEESPFIAYAIQSILAHETDYRKVSAYPFETDSLLIRLQEVPSEILITDFSSDDELRELNGIRKLEALRLTEPRLKIILFTSIKKPEILHKAAQIPVDAIISKCDDVHELIMALDWIISDNSGIYYSTEIQILLNKSLSSPAERILTPSESEIVSFFAMGYSLMDIARFRKRSVSTVSTQKYNAMRKLHLRTNTELIKYAYTKGFIQH